MTVSLLLLLFCAWKNSSITHWICQTAGSFFIKKNTYAASPGWTWLQSYSVHRVFSAMFSLWYIIWSKKKLSEKYNMQGRWFSAQFEPFLMWKKLTVADVDLSPAIHPEFARGLCLCSWGKQTGWVTPVHSAPLQWKRRKDPACTSPSGFPCERK